MFQLKVISGLEWRTMLNSYSSSFTGDAVPVGETVGALVGEVVGEDEGAVVGETVGDVEGAAVGACVSAAMLVTVQLSGILTPPFLFAAHPALIVTTLPGPAVGCRTAPEVSVL